MITPPKRVFTALTLLAGLTTPLMADHRGAWIYEVFDEAPLTHDIWAQCAFEPTDWIPRYTGDDPLCARTFEYCDSILHAPEFAFLPQEDALPEDDPYGPVEDGYNVLVAQFDNCLREDIKRYRTFFVETVAALRDAEIAGLDDPSEGLIADIRADHANMPFEKAIQIGRYCGAAEISLREKLGRNAASIRFTVCEHAEWYRQVYMMQRVLTERFGAAE